MVLSVFRRKSDILGSSHGQDQAEVRVNRQLIRGTELQPALVFGVEEVDLLEIFQMDMVD